VTLPRLEPEFDSRYPLQISQQTKVKMSESRARYTSEEAVLAVGNRYDLVLIASARVRELSRGHKTKLSSSVKNGPIVTSLREIEEGLVGREYLKKVRLSDK
jgi:DNA-directed RNA polymerase subunit omega